MMATLISLAFSIGIAILLGAHSLLLVTNMSSIEMAALYIHNPFKKEIW